MSGPQQSRRILEILFICAVVSTAPVVTPLFAQKLRANSQFRASDFPLVRNNKPAVIIVSSDDFKVAQIAAADLAADIENVTGKKPALKNTAEELVDCAVIIGTLGNSPLIDSIATSKLDASRIRGHWESYIIATVERPKQDSNE